MHILKIFSLSISECQKTFGRMFEFAQRMAGLQYNEATNLLDTVHQVIGALRSRVYTRSTLLNLVHLLRMSFFSSLG